MKVMKNIIYISYWYYLLMYLFYYLIVIIIILISVAFFTLFERKLLSYIHKRKGPNKARILGWFQPFSDAIKLISKELIYSTKINYSIYILRPIIIIIITLTLWTIFPSNWITKNYSILLILCCFRISVYPIILGGWSSNSKYAILGRIRGLAQSISYEVRLVIIIIRPMLLCETINLHFLEFQKNINLGNWLWPTIIILYISRVAEVNRTPFDFVEGESELVSGFNIEYYSFSFAFLFLAEYSIIIWIRRLNSILCFPQYPLIITTLLYAYSIVWLRASVPRIRYDELIYLCWKIFLPRRIIILRIIYFIKYLILLNL